MIKDNRWNWIIHQSVHLLSSVVQDECDRRAPVLVLYSSRCVCYYQRVMLKLSRFWRTMKSSEPVSILWFVSFISFVFVAACSPLKDSCCVFWTMFPISTTNGVPWSGRSTPAGMNHREGLEGFSTVWWNRSVCRSSLMSLYVRRMVTLRCIPEKSGAKKLSYYVNDGLSDYQ